MAAVQLADNRDRSAIPALNRALQDEQDANERLNIARALNVFSDPRGGETMAKLCADGSLREDLRLEAAGELQASGHENCFASVAEILSATHVPALKLAALDYLNRSHTELTPATEQYLVVTLGLMKSLKSEIAMVRQRATACIVRYHITAARSYLRAAAEKETDPATKAAMESAAKAMSK